MCLVLWLSSLFFMIRNFYLIVCLICFFSTWLWLFIFNKHSVHFKWQYCSPFLFKRDRITGSIVNITKFTGVDCSIPGQLLALWMVVSERPVSPSFRGKELRSPKSLGPVRSWASGLCRRSNVQPRRERQHEFLSVTFTASHRKCICWVLLAAGCCRVGAEARVLLCARPSSKSHPLNASTLHH